MAEPEAILSDVTKEQYYQTMIAEGRNSTWFQWREAHRNFDGKMEQTGEIKGLSMHTKRGGNLSCRFGIYGLPFKSRLECITKVGNFSADRLIVVGVGSKNKLWNQIRADVGCPY